MATTKSPFLIARDFLSPLKCEEIVNKLKFYIPDTNDDGTAIKMSRHHDQCENIIYEQLKPLIPSIEQHFKFKHRGTELINFEFHATGTEPIVQCDNSSYIKKQWARTRDRDFSVTIFLVDHQDSVPFDSEYEVYGGKLEFPQHNFGFNPVRGTLLVYPSGPHFINAFSPIIAGDLIVAKTYLAAEVPYFHDPSIFPGNYKNWF
jgi:hypothetical protein